ncbi:aminotransferase class IV [Aquabacter spiritensis]|uniref:Probable branched-chain-amino-acid aminotransferase n=1 Tax=Aquabacter spiritensis TaxID=933073 RepID=A0A4R3LRR7_9HYPH|nr:aminotransferase class IV [Aquabacter spiritensis]TCT03294.1 branched-chain amino acid aminotransferase [Aquabacter spiritensis]
MKVWLNGEILDADTARIAPDDRGLTLGDGLFETLQARAGTPLRLAAHRDRLARGAALLDLPLPELDLHAALCATLAANGLSDGALRLTVTRGSGARGVLPPAAPTPTVLITAGPLPPRDPVRLVLATVTRRNEMSPLSKIKSLNYLDNILARQEAERRGAHDALLLNTQGQIAESSMATLFVVRDGALLTPPVSDGALPGILRAELLQAGAIERSLRPEDVAAADEIFLTTSLGLRAVVAFEEGAHAPGPVAAALSAALAARTGA